MPFYYRGNLTLIRLYYSAGSRRLTRSVVTADGDCARRGDRVRSREHASVCAASSTTSSRAAPHFVRPELRAPGTASTILMHHHLEAESASSTPVNTPPAPASAIASLASGCGSSPVSPQRRRRVFHISDIEDSGCATVGSSDPAAAPQPQPQPASCSS